MAGIKTTYSYLFTSEPQRFMIHDIRTPYGSSEDRFKSPYYEIMFAYMLYAASTYVFSFIGYDGFFGLSVNHACLKMKIYCKMFEDALKSKDNIYGNIRQVIAEQNRLFRLVNLIQDTFNIWLGLILIATMIQLCNCMYTLTTSLETATLIYCAGWEDIYETKIRKVVQIMIARSQRPLEIVAFNIKIFDMDLFVSDREYVPISSVYTCVDIDLKMKTVILLCALFGASMAQQIEYYRTANDYLDMNAVVEDPKKLQEFVDCFLERQPCDEVPASYLAIIPDSLETACVKCNPAQKHLANTFLTGLRKKMPTEYDNFVKKFDPEGKYMDTFLEIVKGY
ncbi:unnamed protein product [Colias eurytheme]|nr:unnamed protein product [Colias eurytheme]